jgi:hypothetical protein
MPVGSSRYAMQTRCAKTQNSLLVCVSVRAALRVGFRLQLTCPEKAT